MPSAFFPMLVVIADVELRFIALETMFSFSFFRYIPMFGERAGVLSFSVDPGGIVDLGGGRNATSWEGPSDGGQHRGVPRVKRN